MLWSPPRNTPRILLPVILILSICFFYQWRNSEISESWALRKSQEVKHQKSRFESFLTQLLEYRPSYESLDLPDDWQTIRIEDINEESEQIDHLKLNENDFNQSAEAHSRVLELIPNYKDVVRFDTGSKGIITVGGGTYQPVLIVSIRMLRKTKCTLPIEVFVPEESDYDPYTCDVVLKELNAKCIVLPKFDNITISRYQYKSAAFLFTSFEHTLFLDADNFPLIDPEPWFYSKPYHATGLITWPDFWASTTSPVYYRMTNQTAPPLLEHASTEAGSIIISRKRHASTLLLAFYYNLFGPGFYYELLSQNGIGGEGDKETWVAAARALNGTYYQVRERNQELSAGGKGETVAMMQFDPEEDWKLQRGQNTTLRNRPDAKAVLIHCNRLKLDPAEVLERLGGFQLDGQRMWGSKQDTVEKFGRDVEAEVWGEVLEVACSYGKVFTEVDDKAGLCVNLRRFWWEVIMEEELDDRINVAQKNDLAAGKQVLPDDDEKELRSN